jgi:two-component system, chemotaxis family, chemotaxis protein CheY
MEISESIQAPRRFESGEDGPPRGGPMLSLIVEDELTSRLQLKHFLDVHGPCDVAVTGDEAIEAVGLALGAGTPYDLICLDIGLPGTNGQAALARIRSLEAEALGLATQGARIFMTTARKEIRSVAESFGNLCDEYLVKPVRREKLEELLDKYHLRG